jgi:hypothetical protein
MLGQRIVKSIMIAVASAASVEALEADIESSRIILFNLVSKLSFEDFKGLAAQQAGALRWSRNIEYSLRDRRTEKG